MPEEAHEEKQLACIDNVVDRILAELRPTSGASKAPDPDESSTNVLTGDCHTASCFEVERYDDSSGLRKALPMWILRRCESLCDEGSKGRLSVRLH